jgi:hypothetical protein
MGPVSGGWESYVDEKMGRVLIIGHYPNVGRTDYLLF